MRGRNCCTDCGAAARAGERVLRHAESKGNLS
jgi:hypothetical protein